MGGKWKARLVWTLMRLGPQSFSDLRRAVPPISDRILTRELKELGGWGLIERTEHPVVPPRTEYSLTAFGKTAGDGSPTPCRDGRSAGLHLGQTPTTTGIQGV
jgi:DNA-binding HxlR family transcriptional regulator